MAQITNQQIIDFANERGRVLADLIEKTRRTAEQFAIDVVTIEALAAYSGAANGDEICDGAAVPEGSGLTPDGRKVVTKLQIAQLKFVAAEMVAKLLENDSEQLVGNWTTNSTPAF